MKALLIVIILALIGALGYIVYDKVLYGPSVPPTVVVVTPTSTEPVACTMDAKMCPDGSYVGRTGPTCEFAACPGGEVGQNPIIEGTESWETSTAYGMSFRYPRELGTSYIHTAKWPPTLDLAASLSVPFACNDSESRMISGQLFCVKMMNEGAAGSVYTSYEYVTEVTDKAQGRNVYIFKFALHAPQCSNYDEPKKTECSLEEKMFSVDNLVHTMVRTVNFVSLN